jgi:hypothetical protein
VHRDITISVSAGATDALVHELCALDGVITLSLQRGESLKPPGDVITATVLNVEADAVLRLAERAEEHGPVSVTTASVDSILDTERQPQIRKDHDEALWEEAETAMRRHTRINLNFFLTSFTGGALAAVALISSSAVTSATALVAGGIIAPVVEPVVRVALSIVNRHRARLARSLIVCLLTWVSMAAGGLLTMLALRAGGHYFVSDFLHNRTAAETLHPPAVNLIISACGAVAAAVVVASGRFSALAGPLVALQLLPAAAITGIAIELGEGSSLVRGISRMGIDVGMVLVAGLAIFTYKHFFVHGRRVPPR